jgi:hypothetical protein
MMPAQVQTLGTYAHAGNWHRYQAAYQADFLERTGATFGTPKAEFQNGDRFNFLE